MFPSLSARWLSGVLPGPLPSERRATCDDCVMCDRPGAVPDPGPRYRPDLKCCTYLPDLPNFSVGLGLADAVAATSLRARISRGHGVTPLGLARSRSFDVLYAPAASFGLAPGLTCPHLDSTAGTCTIWRVRNGVCATWFCRHERGALGLSFWEAVRRYLTVAEEALAVFALMEIGFDPAHIAAASAWREAGGPPAAEELGGAPDPARLVSWGPWLGREAELYGACAEVVGPLSASRVLEIGGIHLQAAAALVRQRLAALQSTTLPAELEIGPMETIGRDTDGVYVSAYCPTDPATVPRVVYDNLHVIAGPSDTAPARFREETGYDLDPRTLRRLVDAGILVER